MSVGVGLEVDSASLRAAVVERKGSSLHLLAWQDIPCETGSPQALTQTLTHLRRTLRLKQGIVLGMPSSSVLMTTVDPLVVDTGRASLAIRFELQQNLPFDVQQAAWHYHWLNGTPPQGAVQNVPGGKGEASPFRKAVVVAMKRSRLDERLACCRRAGLSVRAVAFNPLAVINLWRQDLGAAAPPSGLFLHLGESYAEWIVWSPTQFQVLPVTMDPGAQSFESLVQEIARGAEQIRESSGGLIDAATKVWTLGDHSRLRDVEEQLTTVHHMRVVRFDLSQTLRTEKVRLEQPDRSVVALGLALQGLGTASLPVNLLAESQSLEAARRIKLGAVAVGGACALVAVGCGVSGMLDVWQRHSRVLAQLNARQETYQSLRPEVRTMLKAQALVERRTDQLRVLVTDRTLLGSMLLQIVEAMPDDVWLTKLDASKRGGIEGVVEGRAKSFQSATQFIDQLKSVARMTDVRPLTTSVMIDEASGMEVVSFSVIIERSDDDEPDEAAEDE